MGGRLREVVAQDRLQLVPHFSSGVEERAKRERAWKSPTREKATRGGERVCLFSRGVIFTRARVSLALLSLRKNGGLLVVYAQEDSTVIVSLLTCRYL